MTDAHDERLAPLDYFFGKGQEVFLTMDFHDLDYFFAADGIAYLARTSQRRTAGVLACPVFWPDPAGDRVHAIRGRYRKAVTEFNREIFDLHPEYRSGLAPRNLPRVPAGEIAEVCRPRDALKRFLQQEDGGLWRLIVERLGEIAGVPVDDIGIFGSYLVGLNQGLDGRQVKDVDFVIYGFDNYRAVRAGFPELLASLGFGPISAEHVAYHARKFGSQFAPGSSTFELTLANKWSSMQIAPGLLNTLRFIHKDDEAPPDPLAGLPIAGEAEVAGVVVDDDGANFMPRTFRLAAGGGEYLVVTHFWAFQACVRRGDRVSVRGNLHADGSTLSLDLPVHGLRILEPVRR